MAYPEPEPEPEFSPRPLQYSPADYVLLVEVRRDGDGKLLVFEAITGDQIPKFFSNGACEVDLSGQSQVFLTNVGLFCPDGLCHYYDIPLTLLAWKAKVRLMRLTDQKIVELCTTYQKDHCEYGEFDLLEDHIWGPMILQDLERIIHEAGPKVTASYMSDLVEQVGVDITHLEMAMSLKYQLVPEYEDKDAFLSIVGFSLEPSYTDAGTGDVEAVYGWGDDRHGVSFAHLIEAMDKWDD